MDEARHPKTAASTGTVAEILHVVGRRNTWIRFILAQRYSKNTKHSNDVNNPFDESLQEKKHTPGVHLPKLHNTALRNWQKFWKKFNVEVRMLWAREYFEWIISKLDFRRAGVILWVSMAVISCHARPHPMTHHNCQNMSASSNRWFCPKLTTSTNVHRQNNVKTT